MKRDGAALLTAVTIALLLSIVAGGVLMMSAHQAEITAGSVDHKQAQYLAEAAMVIINQRISSGAFPELEDPAMGGEYDVIPVNTPNANDPPDLDIVLRRATVSPSVENPWAAVSNRLGIATVSPEGATFSNTDIRDVDVLIDPENPMITHPDSFRAFL